MLTMFLKCLPYAFVIYAVINVGISMSCVAVILTIGAYFAMYYWRVSPSQNEGSAVNSLLKQGTPCIIAHRGGCNDAPENTLAAFREAKKNGAHGVEFDVDFTCDGVAVLLHDQTVDRTTNGSGYVGSLTLNEVKQLSASAKHPKRDEFPDERIPTLAEATELCLELGLVMFLDMKTMNELSVNVLLDLFRRYPRLYQNAFICSFFPHIVYKLKRADPRISTALTFRHHWRSRKVDGTENTGPWHMKVISPIIDSVLEWSHYAWLWYFCGNDMFLMFLGDASKRNIEHFRERGVKVIVWTVNRPVEQRYVTDCLHASYMTDTLNPDGCGPQVT